MPPKGSGEDPRESTISTRVRSGTKTALIQYAHELDVDAGPYEDVNPGTLQREAVRNLLAENWDSLPPEAKDALDDDLRANAGAGGFDADDAEDQNTENGADQEDVDEAVENADVETDGGVVDA